MSFLNVGPSLTILRLVSGLTTFNGFLGAFPLASLISFNLIPSLARVFLTFSTALRLAEAGMLAISTSCGEKKLLLKTFEIFNCRQSLFREFALCIHDTNQTIATIRLFQTSDKVGFVGRI